MGVWTLGVNLLEGTRVPVYLVIVGADVGNDPRHSYQDDNVDLRERREREAVRGRVHPQDAGTCPAVASPPPTGNTSRGFQQDRCHLNLPHKHRGRKNECDFWGQMSQSKLISCLLTPSDPGHLYGSWEISASHEVRKIGWGKLTRERVDASFGQPLYGGWLSSHTRVCDV